MSSSRRRKNVSYSNPFLIGLSDRQTDILVHMEVEIPKMLALYWRLNTKELEYIYKQPFPPAGRSVVNLLATVY